ncbi:MAG: hypothetical protein EBQ58_03985 [Betaproteobacteria bacterium]|nr:hypothetical protein [Betaproteobacteria bacterium]
MSKTVAQESLAGANSLLKKIPDAVRNAVREPLDAQAVLLLLVTGAQTNMRDNVRALALEQLGETMVACWDRLAPHMFELPDETRLVVLDLCVPTLTQLTKQQYVAFRTALTAAMRSDNQVDLFEWMTRIVLTRRIETRFGALSQKKRRAPCKTALKTCELCWERWRTLVAHLMATARLILELRRVD